MSPIQPALDKAADEIRRAAMRLGYPIRLDLGGLTDRSDSLALKPPGIWSPNRSCRLVRAADGWIAVNLPRPDDTAMIPAWLRRQVTSAPWRALMATARRRSWRPLVKDARVLGLAVGRVGEASGLGVRLRRMGTGGRPRRGGPAKVIDLSSLWAGPLCGAVLAETGAAVVKLESRRRPDVMREGAPTFFDRLNGKKGAGVFDIASPEDLAWLRGEIAKADVLITSARPRAFAQAGLEPADLFAVNPALVWVAVTGYGFCGRASDRVAFGDDAAAAGGLVRWTRQGEPRFLGDALADPITGLCATAGALEALARGGGFLVDAPLAACAAQAARTL